MNNIEFDYKRNEIVADWNTSMKDIYIAMNKDRYNNETPRCYYQPITTTDRGDDMVIFNIRPEWVVKYRRVNKSLLLRN